LKVYFSHGKESGPWGSKIQRLSHIATEFDFTVQSIDYTKIDNPDHRVEHLLKILKDETEEYILVGSSMGGYVSLIASGITNAKAVFLLAPALYMQGYEKQTYPANQTYIESVHGWSDETIPYANSVKFAEESDSTLHLISGDHRLNSSLPVIEILFRQFLVAVSK